MAKEESTYPKIMRELKARHYAPFYLLMGDESYYIDKISDYISDNVLQPEEKDFNLQVVYGPDVTATQIVDLARRYPMMSEYQVVVVKEAQAIKALGPLEIYLANPMKSTILVWCYKNGTMDGRKKVTEAARKVGVVFVSSKLKEYQLPAFISEYVAGKKLRIEEKACQMMAGDIGADLNRITTELDKVILSLSENEKVITPDIIEKQVGVNKDFNLFEFRRAIIQKDVKRAYLIMKYFNSNPKSASPYQILPFLFKYFQNLFVAFYAPQRNNENELAAYLGLRSGWAARDYITGMRHYTARKVMDILSKIRDVDAKLKGIDNPNTPPEELMLELVSFILG